MSKNDFLSLLSLLLMIISSNSCDKLGAVDYVPDNQIIERSCVNLVNPNRITKNVSLSEKGDLSKNDSKIVTDYICVYLGEAWYQKTIYLHICCTRDNDYGFHADAVVFYDQKKNFILRQNDISGPLFIPQKARFARIEFEKTDTMLYAAVSNRSLLSVFSEYDNNALSHKTDDCYSKVNNSNSSISHVLRTGYDYLDRGFGYGSLHTAFNSKCIKTLAYNNYYAGEKWQIDCSSFVELALTGIRYVDSRYVRGNEEENKPSIGSFCFDDQAEYNYMMMRFPEECGADYGRMYANKIAKYFYDRGYLYEVDESFSNVQAGDLLFKCSGAYINDFFKGITHVGICSDVWSRKNGTKGFRVLETASEKEYLETNSNYNDKFIYGARPELPLFMGEEERELIFDYDALSFTFDLHAGELYYLTSFSLCEDLILREIYTLRIDCNLPPEVTVICKNSSDKTPLGSSDVSEFYQNQSIIKHFGVRESMISGKKDVIEVYLYSPNNDVKGTVLIDYVSLKKGYIRNND